MEKYLLSFIIPFYGINKIKNKDGKTSIHVFGIITSFILLLCYLTILTITLFLFKDRFSYFGVEPLCNLNEERTLVINGFVFPLCYRCMMIIVSFIISFILMFLLKCRKNKALIILSIIGILVCFIDGIIQYGFGIESTNVRRIITGISCGVSLAYLINYFLRSIKIDNCI